MSSPQTLARKLQFMSVNIMEIPRVVASKDEGLKLSNQV